MFAIASRVNREATFKVVTPRTLKSIRSYIVQLRIFYVPLISNFYGM